MRRWLILLLAGMGVGVVMAALVIFSSLPQTSKVMVGKAVPEAETENVIGNQPLILTSFRGKAVAINFWATWCIPCQNEMPLLEKYQQKYADRLVVIGVNAQESKDAVTAYIAENHITFPIGLDLPGDMLRLWSVQGYPTTYFIDKDGILRATHIGELREDTFDGYLKILGVLP
jgi:cytochrome c biogenesis protein CcmG, thiol:disulfide interchange protein DsbE